MVEIKVSIFLSHVITERTDGPTASDSTDKPLGGFELSGETAAAIDLAAR
jgi:hypothetical protein